MRITTKPGLRRSAAFALAAAGLASAALAPASASAASSSVSRAHQAHLAHLAHLHHLHHLHVQHLAHLKAVQAARQAAAASRSADRATLTTTTAKTPAAVRALAKTMVPASQWYAFDQIITRESSWVYTATNASSGAYGLPQALPGSKMASVASDWRTNPVTQIKWGLTYMTERYGSPSAAWVWWQNHHWY